MATSRKKVSIGIEVDKRGASRDYKKFSSDVKKQNKQIRNELQKTKQASSGLGLNLKALGAAAGGLLIFSKVNSLFRESIKLAGEQASAVAKVEQTIIATGGAAGVTSDELQRMASEFQNVTTFGDEVILRGQSMLLTFKQIGKDVFPAATEAMLNMSVAMGTDVKESAIQLGKALNDPTTGLTALRRVGITFSKEQENLIKNFQRTGDIASAQKLILKELESQFGGLARAVAVTGEGPLIQFNNVVGDVKELLGDALIPVILEATAGFKDFLIEGQETGQLKATFEGIANSFSFLFAIIKDTFNGLSAVFKIAAGGINALAGIWFTAVAKIVNSTRALVDFLPDKIVPDGWVEGLANATRSLEELSRQGALAADELFEGGVADVAQGSAIEAHFRKIAGGIREVKKESEGLVGTGGLGVVSGGSVEDPKASAKAQKAAERAQKAAETEAQQKAAADTAFIESESRKFEEAIAIRDEFALRNATDSERELVSFQNDLKEKNLILREAGLEEIDIVQEVINKRQGIESAAADARLQTNLATTGAILSNLGAALAGFKKFAIAQKAIALTEAGIQGFLAVQKALASGPPPANILLAGAIGLKTAANIQNIAAQKFQQGGVVQGPRAGDQVPILANGGERVLTARQNRQFENFLSGGGGSTVNFGNITINSSTGDPNEIAAVVRDTVAEQIDRFAEMQRDADIHGVLA